MTTLTFDTLELTRTLKEAGIPPEQAEAVVRVIVKAHDGLVTKDHLDIRLAEQKTDMIKWMVGLAMAQMALLFGILLKLPS